MENNILQNLISLLNNNGGNQSPSQPQVQLYPAEAYPPQQPPQANNQNALLPLILSLFGQNNGSEALGNLISGQNGDLSSMLSLISSLSKKKDEKDEKKTIIQEDNGLMPKDEML